MRRIVAFLCLLAGLIAAAGSLRAETRPIVVELFTSQSCSSCPPADALLRELAGRADVIALGYHISYWDRLGWKDPLSSEAATNRQKEYARRLSGRVYTPEMVVEGTNEMVGSDRVSVAASLRQKRPEAIAPVDFAADRASVAIGSGAGAGEVLLVRFMRSRVTDIAAGENAGRTLQDANGVTAVTRLGEWDGSARSYRIDPPRSGEGLAVLVQATDGRMLGAAAVLGPDGIGRTDRDGSRAGPRRGGSE